MKRKGTRYKSVKKLIQQNKRQKHGYEKCIRLEEHHYSSWIRVKSIYWTLIIPLNNKTDATFGAGNTSSSGAHRFH
jgi:hypothetical protein